MRLIDDEGKQIGVVPLQKAISLTEEKHLDLLLVSPEAKPPVCKMINYGQFRYQQQKKERQAKKTVKSQTVKELKMSPKISEHDYQVRVSQGVKFLSKGYKVKLTISFRGREIVHPELGKAVIDRFVTDMSELANTDGQVIRANRTLAVILNPK